MDEIGRSVLTALGKRISWSTEQVLTHVDNDLENLGLESHGFYQMLLELEQLWKLPEELDPDDDDLHSPRSLIAYVRTCVHAAESKQ